MHSDADLDRMLDDALQQYCEFEPRAGLEDRVLRFARTSRAQWKFWALVPAGAAFIFGLIAFLWLLFPSPQVPPVGRSASLNTPAVWKLERTVVPIRVSPAVGPRHLVTHPQRTQGREVFPSPYPLTAEERALLALRSRHVKEANELVAHGEIEPLSIPTLRIQPLPDNGE